MCIRDRVERLFQQQFKAQERIDASKGRISKVNEKINDIEALARVPNSEGRKARDCLLYTSIVAAFIGAHSWKRREDAFLCLGLVTQAILSGYLRFRAHGWILSLIHI